MRRITLKETIAATVAALVLAATPAFAKPVDRADRFESPTSSLSGITTPHQDLRGEQAQEAARIAGIKQDLRGEHARDAARGVSTASVDLSVSRKAPVYWSYAYEAPKPTAQAGRTPAHPAAPDDDFPWAPIAAAVALLAMFGGAVYVTTRAPRTTVA
jgi:hypothetical protein